MGVWVLYLSCHRIGFAPSFPFWRWCILNGHGGKLPVVCRVYGEQWDGCMACMAGLEKVGK